MDDNLRGIPSVFVYLDRILAARANSTDHANHLRHDFQLFPSNSLNWAKSVFGASELTYLGHCVNATGIPTLSSRVDTVRDYPVPDSKASLQFLGMITFYHCFMLLLAEKLYPLHEATKAKGQIITWTTECQLASAKSALASATFLHHPHPMTMTNNTVDASDKAVDGKNLVSR